MLKFVGTTVVDITFNTILHLLYNNLTAICRQDAAHFKLPLDKALKV